MNRESMQLFRALSCVLLLVSLGSVVLAVQASDAKGSIPKQDLPAALAHQAGIDEELCYGLDTSRPEWLGWFVYLPILVRDSAL
jgi:hypothetical protein